MLEDRRREEVKLEKEVSTMSDSANGDGGPAIGIDLGTTFSCVGILVPATNRVDIVPNDQVGRT